MNSRSFCRLCIVTGLLLIAAPGCKNGSKESAEKAKDESVRKAEARSKKSGTKRPDASHAAAARVAKAGRPSEEAYAPIAQAASTDTAGQRDLLLTPEPYYYESVGRRDIFVSLVSQEYRAETAETRSPASQELKVVGILWAENDRFALVESAEGRSRILHEGDSIGDGTVARVLPDRIIVHVNLYGTSRSVTLPLVEGGGFNENPRSRRR